MTPNFGRCMFPRLKIKTSWAKVRTMAVYVTETVWMATGAYLPDWTCFDRTCCAWTGYCACHSSARNDGSSCVHSGFVCVMHALRVPSWRRKASGPMWEKRWWKASCCLTQHVSDVTYAARCDMQNSFKEKQCQQYYWCEDTNFHPQKTKRQPEPVQS